MHPVSIISVCYFAVLATTSLAAKHSAKSIERAVELQCPPCDKITCHPKNPKKLRCRGGTTLGVCNCCPQCAKLENEPCGGYRDYLGTCDAGLSCEVTADYENSVVGDARWDLPGERSAPEGICTVDTFTGNEEFLGDQPYGYQPNLRRCKPECTPEFCGKNPRDICSARTNADVVSECQGDCQHTSCRACRYVYDDNDCPKCRHDDFKCLKQFGTCVRRKACHKDRFPCKQNKKPTDLAGDGVFKCMVAECL